MNFMPLSEKGSEIFEALADKYSRNILSLISEKELSATGLSLKANISQATVYRKIKLLESLGLIEIARIDVNEYGGEERFYRSLLDEITYTLKAGKESAEIKIKTPAGKIAVTLGSIPSKDC